MSSHITWHVDKQFTSREFKEYAGNMRIIVKIVSIKAHHSIEMMKRYHESLRRAYSIISTEISEIDSELALQMTFKVINDSIEFNDLISTLLIFEAYLRMIEMNASSSTITQRAIAMKKTMNEIRKLHAIRQINDALNIKNDSTFLIHNLSLNSLVLIFRKSNIDQSESWKELFKLLSIQSESAIVELSNESIKFRFTSVKSYYRDDHADDEDLSSTSILSMIESSNLSSFIEFENDHFAIDSIVRTFIHHESFASSSKRDRERSKKYFASIAYLNFTLNSIINVDSSFIASRQQEIAELLEKDVFLSVNRTEISSDIRIFSFRFVNEIKHSKTNKAFEKFRLMIQAFKNQNKTFVLTQSLIIQRVSQRLIICLAVILSMKLYLKDIIQTYVQSRSTLNKDFYVQLSSELIKLIRIFNDCILKVIKSLYDVSKADNHWFKTYHDHHIDKLRMIQFTYDSCLLYIIVISHIDIRIVSMQTDDILILADQSFAVVEKEAIHSAKILIKTRKQLNLENSLKFNDTRVERIGSNDAIYFRQETHIQDIQLIQSIDIIITSVRDKMRIKLITKEQYVTQRARDVYLTFICQFEASFDLSHATQFIESIFSSNDIISLNKRLQWQIINQIRNLRYVKLNQSFLQLVVFIDFSFANNRDFSSQIDYVICLFDSINKTNIVHWFSVKCKRVIRSVLTVELFAMIHDFDVDSVLKTIFTKMLNAVISLILAANSKSLYDCLVRLRTTIEKRLIIDVMTLRQFYERREITEIKWVHEINNLVDFMTKSKSSSALRTLIDINQINLNTIEWVERTATKKTVNQKTVNQSRKTVRSKKLS